MQGYDHDINLVLNLNVYSLKLARKAVLDEILDDLNKVRDYLDLATTPDAAGLLPPLAPVIEFWARALLGP
jgi:hypothetical protein